MDNISKLTKQELLERVQVQLRLDHDGQTVYRLAHIGVPGDQVDLGLAISQDHERASKVLISFCKTEELKSPVISAW